MSLNGKKARLATLMTLIAFFTHFQEVLRNGPLLDGKTTAISKRSYYTWKNVRYDEKL